jgi:hypothetical protein
LYPIELYPFEDETVGLVGRDEDDGVGGFGAISDVFRFTESPVTVGPWYCIDIGFFFSVEPLDRESVE